MLIQYVRTFIPGCQRCHLRLTATVQGLGTISSVTSTAGCKTLFFRSTSRAILQTPRVHPLAFKAAFSGSGTKYSGYVACDADIRLVFRPYHRILRGVSRVRESLRTKIRAELSSNGSGVRSAGFTPHKNPRRALMKRGACKHLQRSSTSSVTMFRAVPMSLHRLYFVFSAPLFCLWEVFGGMYYIGSTAAVARAY